jgi:hypothetical protein
MTEYPNIKYKKIRDQYKIIKYKAYLRAYSSSGSERIKFLGRRFLGCRMRHFGGARILFFRSSFPLACIWGSRRRQRICLGRARSMY